MRLKLRLLLTPTTVYVAPFKTNFCPDVLTNPVLEGLPGVEPDDVVVVVG